jgi:hypothetical protein
MRTEQINSARANRYRMIEDEGECEGEGEGEGEYIVTYNCNKTKRTKRF